MSTQDTRRVEPGSVPSLALLLTGDRFVYAGTLCSPSVDFSLFFLQSLFLLYQNRSPVGSPLFSSSGANRKKYLGRRPFFFLGLFSPATQWDSTHTTGPPFFFSPVSPPVLRGIRTTRSPPFPAFFFYQTTPTQFFPDVATLRSRQRRFFTFSGPVPSWHRRRLRPGRLVLNARPEKIRPAEIVFFSFLDSSSRPFLAEL